jgi:hypothetical protein
MCVVHAHIVCDLGNSMMSKCMCSLYWHNWRWIIPFYGLYPCDLVLEGRKSLAKSRALIFHQSSCFSSITFFIISRILVETKQPLFVAILWSIWRVRNECIWENKQVNLVASCRLVSRVIRDFNCATIFLMPILRLFKCLLMRTSLQIDWSVMLMELFSWHNRYSVSVYAFVIDWVPLSKHAYYDLSLCS